MQKLYAEKLTPASTEQGQDRVIRAALSLVKENAKLKASHLYLFIRQCYVLRKKNAGNERKNDVAK